MTEYAQWNLATDELEPAIYGPGDQVEVDFCVMYDTISEVRTVRSVEESKVVFMDGTELRLKDRGVEFDRGYTVNPVKGHRLENN